ARRRRGARLSRRRIRVAASWPPRARARANGRAPPVVHASACAPSPCTESAPGRGSRSTWSSKLLEFVLEPDYARARERDPSDDTGGRGVARPDRDEVEGAAPETAKALAAFPPPPRRDGKRNDDFTVRLAHPPAKSSTAASFGAFFSAVRSRSRSARRSVTG